VAEWRGEGVIDRPSSLGFSRDGGWIIDEFLYLLYYFRNKYDSGCPFTGLLMLLGG